MCENLHLRKLQKKVIKVIQANKYVDRWSEDSNVVSKYPS